MEHRADPHNADDPKIQNADTNVAAAVVATHRGPNRKKSGPKRTAQERKTRQKLQVLVLTLKPIPFKPSKDLNFTSHETLLRRIGLWDFVHVEFESTIRGDLVAQLIASYAPSLRCGYVNGVRVLVNRTQLGRTLKLPLKNGEVAEGVLDGLDLVESIGFVEELVWNWMVLHDDDTCEMPNEVLGCEKLIKEGCLEKVDWVGLMWSMVEKELRTLRLVNCYYVSHLQRLIKTQREELLREAPLEEVEEGDEEEEGMEEDGSGDVKMGGVDELEECNIELNLGQDNVEKVKMQKEQVEEDQKMDFELSKEDPGQWVLGLKNNVGEPILRQCDVTDVKGLDCAAKNDKEGEEGQEQEEEEEEEEEKDAEEDEHEGGFHLSPKCIPLEGVSSHAIEAVQMPFSSGIDLCGNSVGDFISSINDPQMISGPSHFGNGRKRDIGLDNHNSHLSLNGSNKRLRSDNPWNAEPGDFDMCMDQIQHWMGKARLMYATKDRSCEESIMNQQLLLNELQKRDNMIEHLHKAKVDENQKIYRLEKELYMMANLVEGYRKALRETQKAFAEYRERCPQTDEPFYKDVPGSGGLVLSVKELEKERLKQEVEERMNRLIIEKKLKDFEVGWICKLEVHVSRLQSLGNRLLSVEDQVKLLNEMNAKRKISDPPECAPSDGQTA